MSGNSCGDPGCVIPPLGTLVLSPMSTGATVFGLAEPATPELLGSDADGIGVLGIAKGRFIGKRIAGAAGIKVPGAQVVGVSGNRGQARWDCLHTLSFIAL